MKKAKQLKNALNVVARCGLKMRLGRALLFSIHRIVLPKDQSC